MGSARRSDGTRGLRDVASTSTGHFTEMELKDVEGLEGYDAAAVKDVGAGQELHSIATAAFEMTGLEADGAVHLLPPTLGHPLGHGPRREGLRFRGDGLLYLWRCLPMQLLKAAEPFTSSAQKKNGAPRPKRINAWLCATLPSNSSLRNSPRPRLTPQGNAPRHPRAPIKTPFKMPLRPSVAGFLQLPAQRLYRDFKSERPRNLESFPTEAPVPLK